MRKRIVNKELLKNYKTQICVICGVFGVDPDHIKHRGAGGDDTEDNLMPLCRLHHSERHHKGWHRFSIKYPVITQELEKRGFGFVNEFGTWKLRKLN
jgi:predicted restriction endonuclease